MASMIKMPPKLSKSKSYENCLKSVMIWKEHAITPKEPEKQGPARVLSLGPKQS